MLYIFLLSLIGGPLFCYFVFKSDSESKFINFLRLIAALLIIAFFLLLTAGAVNSCVRIFSGDPIPDTTMDHGLDSDF